MGNPIMAREVQEAMDEIERLRAEVEDLKMWADNYRVLAARLTAIVQEDLNK